MKQTCLEMTEWVADEGVAKVVTRAELQNCDAWKRAYRNKCKDHRYYEIVEETLEGGFAKARLTTSSNSAAETGFSRKAKAPRPSV